MQDKICLISGANSGIGFQSALALAKKGAELILVCRTLEKAEQSKAQLAPHAKGNIHTFYADFSKIAETKRVAQEIAQAFPKIDVLLNNAGLISKGYREVSQDGLEMTFAVNHMGYFVLSLGLLESLKAAPQGRIVNVSSEAHRFVRNVDMSNLQLVQGYKSMKAYGLSKLCNIWFTKVLAEKIADTKVTVNALHPGAVATNFGRDSTQWFKTLFKIGKRFLLSPEDGAQTSIFLSTNPELSEISGEYFSKKQITRVSRDAQNKEKAQKLWEMSLDIAELKDPFTKEVKN